MRKNLERGDLLAVKRMQQCAFVRSHGLFSIHLRITFLLVTFTVIITGVPLTSIPALRTIVYAAKQNPPSQLYYGFEYPGTPDVGALGKVEAEIGKGTSLVLWYQSWVQYGQQQAFPVQQLNAIREHGTIPV